MAPSLPTGKPPGQAILHFGYLGIHAKFRETLKCVNNIPKNVDNICDNFFFGKPRYRYFLSKHKKNPIYLAKYYANMDGKTICNSKLGM
jgi:hypothetical protein